MLARLFLWMLCLSLSPAGPELVEWGVHYAQDGDFADQPDTEHRRAPGSQQEHGCAVLSHSCGCHGSTAPGRIAEKNTPRLQPSRRLSWSRVALFADRPVPAPLTPPPIV